MKRFLYTVLCMCIIVGCGSMSTSVDNLPQHKKKGLTYEVYRESPDRTFEVARAVIQGERKEWSVDTAGIDTALVESARIDSTLVDSSRSESAYITTDWKTYSKTVTTNQETIENMNHRRDKFTVYITRQDSGSRIRMEYNIQRRVVETKKGSAREWKDAVFVGTDIAKEQMLPLFQAFDEEGLTPVDRTESTAK